METIAFDHTPHYKTLCDKKSHFSRVSDALAEFVDNSIQACQDCSEKIIDINCYFSKNKGSSTSSYVVISDNGKENFLTHYLMCYMAFMMICRLWHE